MKTKETKNSQECGNTDITGRAILEAQPSSVKTCNSVNKESPNVANSTKNIAEQTDRHNCKNIKEDDKHRQHCHKNRQQRNKGIDNRLQTGKFINILQRAEEAESSQNDKIAGKRHRGNRHHNQIEHIPAGFEETFAVSIKLHQHFHNEDGHAQTVKNEQNIVKKDIGNV